MRYFIILAMAWCLLPGNPVFGAEKNSVSFRGDIAPILLNHCLACHNAKKAEGGYRIDSYEELVKPGDSGEIPIAASTDQVSELLRRLTCEDESERMPAESEPLSAEQIAMLSRWIAEGGKFDGDNLSQSLSLVIPPVQYPSPPEVYDHAIPITATTFSPDGKFIATGGYYEVMIWNTSDAKLVRRIKNLGQRIFALAFSADGQTLAVGCGEPGRSGEVRLVDFEAGKVKGVVARVNDVVLDLAYRPGTNELAVASADSSLRIVNAETLEKIRTIASHADWVTAVAWSDDGALLASASRDKSAKVYDGGTGELISSYLGHGAAVRGVSILADNKQVVSVGADKKMHRWNIEGNKKTAEIPTGGEGYKMIRHELVLFVPCSDKRILQIDMSNNKITKDYIGHGDWVLTVCRQPPAKSETNGGLIASGSFDGEVRIWNQADAGLVHSWTAKP